MRLLGLGAIVLVVISFVCWLSGWAYWNFAAAGAGYGSTVSKLMQGVTFLGTLLEYLAIILLALGFVLGGRSPGSAAGAARVKDH